VTRNLFLIVGAIVGVVVAAPVVLEYAAAWWWLAAPAVLAYAAVLWRWGLAWFNDGDVDDVSIPEKLGGVAILLGWSFVGLALLVFLAMLTAQFWPDVVAALLLLALILGGLWIWTLFDKKKPAAPPPDDLVR
jgi:hypothetical protein